MRRIRNIASLVAVTVFAAELTGLGVARAADPVLPDAQPAIDLPVGFPDPMPQPTSASKHIPPPASDVPVPTGHQVTGVTEAERNAPLEGWTPYEHWKGNGDGTVTSEHYFAPMFRPVGSRWERIDPAVKPSLDELLPLEAAGALHPVRFGASPSRLVRLDLDGGQVTVKAPRLAVGKPAQSGRSVRYSSVATDTDLVYDVTARGLVKKIILKSEAAPRTFTFRIDDPADRLGGVTLTGGSARFTNEVAPGTHLTIPAPFAYEEVSAAEHGLIPRNPDSASMTVLKDGRGYDVTVAVDEEWLKGRRFPVVLDPTLEYDGNVIDATHIKSLVHCGSDGGGCTPNTGDPHDGAGTYTGNGVDYRPARSLFKFSTSSIPSRSRVDSAYIKLWVGGCLGEPGDYLCNSNGTYTMQWGRLTGPWDSSTAWRDRPAQVVSDEDGIGPYPAYTRVERTYSIKNVVSPWIEGSSTNYGMNLKLSTEPTSGSIGGPVFESSNTNADATRKPHVIINYSPRPNPPTNVALTAPSNTSLRATWTTPTSNGGPAVTSYEIRAYASGTNAHYRTETCTAPCNAKTLLNVPYGKYYVRVYARNEVGLSDPSAASGHVALASVPVVTKTVSPVRSVYAKGEQLTYTVKVTNTSGATMPVDLVADEVPAGLAITSGSPIFVGGTECITGCYVQGATVRAEDFEVPPNSFVTVVFKAIAVGADGACTTVTNVAEATNAFGTGTGSVPVTICDGALGVESWWSYVRQAVALDSDAMVNVANGNLVVQAVDSPPVLTRGRLAHVVRRTYNSQDTQLVTLPGSIGGGWQLNFGQADDLAGLGIMSTGLSVPGAMSVKNPLPVTLIDRDGTRHVFTFKQLATALSLSSISASGNRGTLIPKAIDSSGFPTVCVDGTYGAPKGVQLSLYRYVGVSHAHCASVSTGTVLGFAAIRPDRLRTEYSATGRLLSTVDGNGVELRYDYDAQNRLSRVYESQLKPDGATTCAASLVDFCRSTKIEYLTNEVKVTDPAKRVTRYLLDGVTPVSRLVTVVNHPETASSPQNPVVDRVSYTYDGFGDDCDGSTTSNTGQLCSVTDARGHTSRFTYGVAAVGPKRVTAIRDRRLNTTVITYFSAPYYVTADKGTHRTRYMAVDGAGRVGEIHEGGTNNVYQHVTKNTWDGNGTTCREPDDAEAHHLCKITRSALMAGVADEVTEYVYNAEGAMLKQSKSNTGGTPAFIDTTFGYDAQYVRTDGTNTVVSDTVGAGSAVTTPPRPDGSGSPVLYVLSDRTQMLSPRGNAAGTSWANYLTSYSVAKNSFVNPSNVKVNTTCSGRNNGVLCSMTHPHSGQRVQTQYDYNEYGQRTLMRMPSAATTNKVYTYTYYAETERDLTSTVSAAGWLRAVSDPTGKFVAFGYDRAGNIARTWDRNVTSGTPTLFPVLTAPDYTESLRWSLTAPWRFITSQRDMMGKTVEFTIDRHGNVERSRPAKGVEENSAGYDVVSTYDEHGNLTSTQLPTQSASEKTAHSYDIWNNRVATTNPNGAVTVTMYDNVNRVSGTRFTRGAFATSGPVPPACQQTATGAADAPLPEGKLACSTARTYDGRDNLVAETDADGQVTTFVYDAVNRLVQTYRPRNDGVLTTLRTDTVYDADGHITDVCPPRSFSEGGATTCTSTDPYGTHNTIDEGGRQRTATTYRTVGGAAQITTWTYDADGNALAVTDQNGRTVTNSYDKLDRLVSQSVPRDATVDNVTYYTYDAVGNVLSMTEPGAVDTGSGADGDLTISGTTYPSGYVMASGRRFRNLTLTDGARVTITDWGNGGDGRLEIQATGTVSICATCSIDLAGKGAPGGTPGSSLTEPSGAGLGAGPGAGGSPGATTGGGGGGGGHVNAGTAGGVTAGGGAGGAGGPAYGGAVTGTRGLADLGSGGGAGGRGGSSPGGAGGAGGGYLHITANRIINHGTITTAGAKGADGVADTAGGGGAGGGGGSGGDLWLTAPTLVVGTATSAGGAGGAGAIIGGSGSAGYKRYQSDVPDVGGESLGRITAYSYDKNNRLVDTVRASSSRDAAAAGVTASDGSTNLRTRAMYDVDGLVVAQFDPRAFVTSVSAPDARHMTRTDYDASGRPVRMWSPRYDDAAASDVGLSSAQATQCTTTPAPDPVTGVPSFPQNVGVCVTRVAYDPAGNRSRITRATSNGADNRYVTFEYTDDNLLMRGTIPDPTEVSGSARASAATVQFDGTGRPVKVTDALGHQKTTTYTSDGKVASMAGADNGAGINQFEEYGYDADGNQIRKTSWLNHKSDGTVVSNPVLRVSSTTYWTDGLRKDVYGTGTSAADTSRDRTSYTYDAVGNLMTVTSPKANAAGGEPTRNAYTYDNLLASTTVPVATNGSSFRRTSYSYDQAGRKTAESVALVDAVGTVVESGGTLRFAYLPSDRLSLQTGRNGETINHSYDAGGRATSLVNTPLSGPPVTLNATYYLDGLPRTVSERGRTVESSYDGSGGRTAVSAVVDATGARTTTTYTYSDGGKLATATSGVTGTTQKWSYDMAGRPIGREVVNQFMLSRVYNDDDSVAIQQVTSSAGTVRWDYAYDGMSRIKAAHRGTTSAPNVDCSLAPASLPDGLHCTDYDTAGRLSQFKDRFADRAVEYDRNGNRTKYGGAADPAVFTYNADDTMATAKANAAAPLRTHTYAVFGGQLTDGCSTDTYDGFDRMLTTTSSGATGCDGARTTTYTYDALDRQVTRDVSTAPGTTSLFYDGTGDNFLAEVDADNTATDYAFAGATPIAVRRAGSNPVTQYLIDDGHTSITTMIAPGGTIGCSVRYDPFGGAIDAASDTNVCSTGSTPSALLYRAGRRDSTTGAYQLGGRTYDPGKAGFRTPDSYRVAPPSVGLASGTDPLTRNSYTYVNGDPINLADPDGHAQVKPGDSGWEDYAAFKIRLFQIEQAQALGIPVSVNGVPRPEKGEGSLGWAIGAAKTNLRCANAGTCGQWKEPGFWSADTLSTMGKAAANIPSGMGEGLVRFTEGVINTPAMVVQGFANIGQLIKNPSISSDDLISTPKVHLGHVPALYKDRHSMAAYHTMSFTTQAVATVATAKLPGKVKAKAAAKRGGAAPKAATAEAGASTSSGAAAEAAGGSGVRVSAGSGGRRAAGSSVRTVAPKEKVSQVFDEMRQLTYENNAEHALVKTTTGEFQILRGGELGIDLGDDVAEVLAHTHPYTVNATGPSADDIAMLVQLNQRASVLLEHSQTIVFGRQGTIAWR